MGKSYESYLETDAGRLHYKSYGNGPKTLITLHGYGQSHIFLKGLDVLSEKFTIFHFDLPLHGLSDWNNEVIEKEDLKDLFTIFFKIYDIKHFSLVAFSLGGKVLITLLELFPQQIENVILIAPDGIRVNRWYRLATSKLLFKSLFATIVRDPSVYFVIVDTFRVLKIIDASMARFVKSHMDSPEKRNQVYHIWNTYRSLHLKQREIENLLNQNDTDVYLYLGRYDRIIPESKFSGFVKRVSGLKFYLLPHGHNDLIKAVCKRIANDLNT